MCGVNLENKRLKLHTSVRSSICVPLNCTACSDIVRVTQLIYSRAANTKTKWDKVIELQATVDPLQPKGQHTFFWSFSSCFCSALFLLFECLIFSRTSTSCRSSWVNFPFWVSIYLLILFFFLVEEKHFF